MQRSSRDMNPLRSYARLAIALLLSLFIMFPLTMAFVNSWSDFYFNLSNFYMALTMVAPMGIIMVGVMWSMFPNKRLNAGIIAGFVVLFAAGLWLGRTEAFIGDGQFLRAMIPHHSRAILVCDNASIGDPDIARLCDQIVQSQQEEIDLMKQYLNDH